MKILIIFIVCIAASSVITHFLWPKRVIEKEYSSDTVYVRHIIHDTLPAKIKVVRQKEKTNIDSLWKEALDYALEQIRNDDPNDTAESSPDKQLLGNYSFEAEADSTYKDSLITAKVKYHSPLPLHPRSYFIMDFRYKEKTIIETHQNEFTFFDRFKISLNLSPGYGFINKKADIFIGIGFSFIY